MSTESKFLIGAGVVTVILVVVAALFLGKQQTPKSQGQKTDETQLLANAKDTQGDPKAPVRIVEFGDFQCPACGAAYPITKDIVAKNSSKIYFVFRHFPLSIHPNAQIAAQNAEAATLQGKFWQMHDILYEKQNEWTPMQDPQPKFDEYAKSIGIDINKFHDDIKNTIGEVNSDYTLGNKVGVDSTPTFFINGQKYPGVLPQDQFQQIIDAASTSK